MMATFSVPARRPPSCFAAIEAGGVMDLRWRDLFRKGPTPRGPPNLLRRAPLTYSQFAQSLHGHLADELPRHR